MHTVFQEGSLHEHKCTRTPPPLRKHGQGQKNNGHTGSPCLGKPVLARDAQHPWCT